MDRAWGAVIERCSADDLNLGTWFRQGKPVGITGRTLQLSFSAANDRAVSYVQDRTNQQTMVAALEEHTENLADLAILVQEDEGPADRPKSAASTGGDLPYYPGVNPDDAREAMDDPAVENVVNVFKGRIADITSTVPGHDAPDSDS